jgi:hypothetical protein
MRSLKNQPTPVRRPIQQIKVATNVLVLLSDTSMYHLLGGRPLRTVPGPHDLHQSKSGSTTGPGFLTKLRAPTGDTSQNQPGRAHSRTSPIWSNGWDIMAADKQLIYKELFLFNIFITNSY